MPPSLGGVGFQKECVNSCGPPCMPGKRGGGTVTFRNSFGRRGRQHRKRRRGTPSKNFHMPPSTHGVFPDSCCLISLPSLFVRRNKGFGENDIKWRPAYMKKKRNITYDGLFSFFGQIVFKTPAGVEKNNSRAMKGGGGGRNEAVTCCVLIPFFSFGQKRETESSGLCSSFQIFGYPDNL